MKIIDKIRKYRYERPMIRAIRRNYKKLASGPELTRAQEREIRQYYKELIGVRVSLEWHRYFYKRTGIYSKQYIPTNLYYTSLIGKFNHSAFNSAYTDKNLTDLLLPMAKQPKTYLKNCRGHFYIDRKPVDRAAAIAACSNLDEAVIKPSLLAHGEGVKKISVRDGVTSVDGIRIEQMFDRYGKDYLIQSAVRQHADMAALNPSSVNTIRILTYRSGEEVLVLYTVIRIGRQGFDVDNETAGGISTRINADGTLCKYAYGSVGNDHVERTDTGVVLDGYRVPHFAEAVEQVKRYHRQIPYFDLIGWDICIDEQGDPVLIEWNTWPELSQSANGPAFGDLTERVLKEIWPRHNNRNENWD